MSYEQKAEDYHINKVCDIKEFGLKLIEKGEIAGNTYSIEFDGSIFYLSINGNDFEQDSSCEVLRELVKTLKYYEVFRSEVKK